MVIFYIFWYLTWIISALLFGGGLAVLLPWWPVQIVVSTLFCALFVVSEIAVHHLLQAT